MKKLKGIIAGVILCFGMLLLAACGGKSSGITAKDVDMSVETINKNSATIKIVFAENENLVNGTAIPYVMAYKVVDGEESSGVKKEITFSGDVYTSATVTFSSLAEDQEYHFVLYVTFNKKDKKITTIEASTTSYVSDTIGSVDAFKTNLVNDQDGDYILTEDLDFAYESLALFSSESKSFQGTLDGGIYDDNGNLTGCHKISNVTLGNATYIGLFGYLKNATIKNLIIENVTATFSAKSTSHIGTLAGYAIGSYVENVQINEVTLSIAASTSAEQETGGVVGYTKRSSFKNVIGNEISISYEYSRLKNSVGLFAGRISGDALKDSIFVSDCGVSGTLSIITDFPASSSTDVGYLYVGGFVGSVNTSGAINDCYAECEQVLFTNRQAGRSYNVYIGGFAGANGPESTMMYINNCLALVSQNIYGGPKSTEAEFDYTTYDEGYYVATKEAYVGGFIGKANGTFRGINDSYVKYTADRELYADFDTESTDSDTGVVTTTKVLFEGEFFGAFAGDADTYMPNCAAHVIIALDTYIPDTFSDTFKELMEKYINA